MSKVRLENFAVNAHCGELILRVTTNSEVLRSFEVVTYGNKVEPQPDSVCAWWLAEVAKNKTLEVLFLPSGIFSPKQWEALFVLLTTSSTL